jgi:prolyl-tRNA editing enzyme YbaK/EbsC (Cys-tRNA(Pro) deacylase)
MTDRSDPSELTSGGDLEDRVRKALELSGAEFEIIDCDPALADTAQFCAHYGYDLENSANAILVRSKTGEEKFALCIVLADCRLDVNKVVKKKLGVRKASFAGPDETRARTGMEIGGVTPVALPDGLPVWVDARVMDLDRVILGGGSRSKKVIVDPAYFRSLHDTEIVPDLARPAPVDP